MSEHKTFLDANHGPSPDPTAEWLGAYLDGELSAERRAWVEAHLQTCAACQADLEALASLSSLLHAEPLPPASLSPRDFARQVTGRLPRPKQPIARQALHGGLRYTPLGLFAGWAFFQAVLVVSSGLFLVMQLFPEARAALAGLLPFASFAAGAEPVGSGSTALSALLNAAGLLGPLPILGPLGLLSLGIGGLLAVLFLAWLAGFWSHSRNKEIN